MAKTEYFEAVESPHRNGRRSAPSLPGYTVLESNCSRRYLSTVRGSLKALVFLAFVWGIATATAATGKVIKVLPQFLDMKGRTSLSPSLYDRDAYQAVLRLHPERRSGMRFFIEWKAKGQVVAGLRLRLELRGGAQGDMPRELILEDKLPPKTGWFSRWADLTLKEETYKELGGVTSWRVTLWDGDKLLGEQRSFLW